ncbi:MCE family protein [Nocardia sp. SYP-A9097]|uniref:MlaD family protein n=1 Tax=Nocardia sp. SYP-A9097 TaxID=2663237 RepID=UPI00129B6AD2|nr:MlaD family protein [Nocardia sp. SYP-A9097]MRH91294.1 MCE family protein [Nocardia sp. SYP-A9097]
MQLVKRLARLPVSRGRSDAALRHSDLRWGIGGLCAVLVLVAAIGVVYLTGTTPEKTYRAELSQAGTIREGDDVRVAGIPVGKVKSLTLLSDRVRMEFTAKDGVFLGDQTVLHIRMLTVVGGYYLAAEPVGAKPLGRAVIPMERVMIPYNLTQAFQDAVQPVREIDGTVLRRNLAVLSASLDKSPESIRATVGAAADLVGMLDRQNADISRTLSFADEYLTAMRENSAVLAKLVINLGTMENIIRNNKTQVAQALNDLAVVLGDVAPLGQAWDRNLKQRAQPLADAIPTLQQLGDRLGELLQSLRALEQKLSPLLPANGGITVDHSATTLSLPTVCVPVPGGGC